MRLHRKQLLCLLLAVVLALLAGCGATNDWESMRSAASALGDTLEDPQLREDTVAMLDCIIADEPENAFQLVAEVITEADFQEPYAQMRQLLADVQGYELIPSNKSTNVQDGVTIVSIRYMLTAGETRLWVEAVRSEEYTDLAGFYVYPYEEVIQTGTLSTMAGADALQWVFLIVGMLEIGFLIWALLDCCCHKMEKKWMWLLIILAGSLSVLLMLTDSGLRLNYNYGLFFSHTALIRYSTGGFMARLYLPIGAVVYAIMRKKLFETYEETHPRAPETQEKAET